MAVMISISCTTVCIIIDMKTTRDKSQIKVCPRCGLLPMIWIVPTGQWWAACRNNGKQWHEKMQVTDMASRARLIRKWNRLTDDMWCDHGVRIRRHKEWKMSEDFPYWIPQDDYGMWYSCSNCGYTLTPRQEICPKCLKRMRPHP